MLRKQVFDVLKKEGLLTKEHLRDLKDFERQNQGNILDFCVERGIAPGGRLIPLLRKTHLLPVIDLVQTKISQSAVQRLPASVCLEHLVIPFYEDKEELYVAMSNPDDHELVSFIVQKTGKQVAPYLAQKQAIRQMLDVTFNTSAADSQQHIEQLIESAKKVTHDSVTMAQEVPIIALANHLIIFGLRSLASDLHLEPREDKVSVRFRVDGLLHDFFSLPKELLAPILARLKILARLRLDEHLRPQDGRFTFTEAGYKTAVRLSILPTLYGQKAALRFLDTDNEELSLDSLGLNAAHRQSCNESLKYSNGLILVTGPTGSGKTTTLYALIKAIEKQKVNIATIEDPIEYHLRGANQTQVNALADLSFANGLRSILRQDPDIIMVGEIRDRETASIAINAALTGHLVLSSLHTNSAAAAIPRLLDMGIEPYLIASTLRTIIGQRLVRRVCPECQQTHTIEKVPDWLSQRWPSQGTRVITSGTGCKKCLQTGYFGRTGIFEIIKVDDHLHELIVNRAQTSEISRANNAPMLVDDGATKVREGITTPEEISRVIL
ncbi:MAG: GspE/PulE family protein [Patescibacteria group bacterium]|jgi:type IV pilus assembly protein PilB